MEGSTLMTDESVRRFEEGSDVRMLPQLNAGPGVRRRALHDDGQT